MAEKKQNTKGPRIQKPNRPPMGNQNKPSSAFKFNPIYVYGILLVIFLAIQYYSTGGKPVETTWKEVKTTMLKLSLIHI